MTQSDKKRRKLAMAIGESFVAIRRRTARSQAWLSLSAPAMKIYIELKLRWRHKNANNGELFVSIAECWELLRIKPGTAHRAFRELEDKGFIVMTRRGEAGGLNSAVLDNGGCGYSRKATTWAITEEPYKGQIATHAYEKWQPDPITAALWLQRKPWTKKQVHASTSGTMTGPPVEPCNSDSSTSGTYSNVFRPGHGSTSGIPVSTICGGRPGSLPDPQSQESVYPKMADSAARPDSIQQPAKRPWRKPTILEEQDRSLHDFGTWMRDERERLGLSLEDVGLVLRMRPARIEMLEDNRAQTTREQRRKLKALFEARDPAARRAKALAELEAMETSGRRVL